MEPVCFDIMEMIGKQYTIIKETNKNKKLYSEVIKHLEYYIDEYEMDKEYPSVEGSARSTHSLIREYIKEGNIRVDTEFLEYEDLLSSNHYKIIAHKYGGEQKYNDWCDNYC